MLDIGENIQLQLKYMPDLLELYRSYRIAPEAEAHISAIKRNRLVLCDNYESIMTILGITELDDDDGEMKTTSIYGGLKLLYHPFKSGLSKEDGMWVLYTKSAFCINRQPLILFVSGDRKFNAFLDSTAVIYMLREPDIIEKTMLKRYSGKFRVLNSAEDLKNLILDSGEYNPDLNPHKSETVKNGTLHFEWDSSVLLMHGEEGLANILSKISSDGYAKITMHTVMEKLEQLFFKCLTSEIQGSSVGIDVIFVRNLIAVEEYDAMRCNLRKQIEPITEKFAVKLAKMDVVEFGTLCMKYASKVEELIKNSIITLQGRINERWELI